MLLFSAITRSATPLASSSSGFGFSPSARPARASPKLLQAARHDIGQANSLLVIDGLTPDDLRLHLFGAHLQGTHLPD